MLSEISSVQFAEWIAYSTLEPWGEERDDLRMGIMASTIANANRGKNQKPYKPQDFMPSFEQETEEQAAERLIAKAMQALGGAH
jgi:flagellar basal body rod protein FlgC